LIVTPTGVCTPLLPATSAHEGAIVGGGRGRGSRPSHCRPLCDLNPGRGGKGLEGVGCIELAGFLNQRNMSFSKERQLPTAKGNCRLQISLNPELPEVNMLYLLFIHSTTVLIILSFCVKVTWYKGSQEQYQEDPLELYRNRISQVQVQEKYTTKQREDENSTKPICGYLVTINRRYEREQSSFPMALCEGLSHLCFN